MAPTLAPYRCDAAEPPVTPIRPTIPLLPPPIAGNPRKRAPPPSPLESTFSCRRQHLFTLATACNRHLASPSTPTAPLLPAAPIFMPLPPTPSKLESSPMRRSPGIRNLSKFTYDAFDEERASQQDENEWQPRSSPAAEAGNSLGLFNFYRDAKDAGEFSSPELPGSPFSDEHDGRWDDLDDESSQDDSPLSPSAIIFARRISLDLATPSPQSSRSLPDLAALPTVSHNPLGSPVPSLSSSASTASSSSTQSSPYSDASTPSLYSFATPSSPSASTPSPSPVSSCLATFSSTSFFPCAAAQPSNKPAFSAVSSLAQRRLESLGRRRMQKLQLGELPTSPSSFASLRTRADGVDASPSDSTGLGLFA
ncbi:hypothetical protein JCM5296_007139 [Sporobolomyces johnsonii]